MSYLDKERGGTINCCMQNNAKCPFWQNISVVETKVISKISVYFAH